MKTKKDEEKVEFKAVDLDTAANVSNTSPLREFGKLLVGVLVFLALLYFASGAVANLIVPYIPPELEAKIWQGKNDRTQSKTKSADQRRLDRVFARIPKEVFLKLPAYPFYAVAVDNPTVNAVALPGGRIEVYSGLMKLVKNDDDLLFVLGHELGHFAGRDHLRSMGRELIFSLLKSFLGVLPSVTDSTQSVLASGYSRQQEFEADAWGYRILKEANGSKDVSVRLFEILRQQAGAGNGFDELTNGILRTHPFPEERAQRLKEMGMGQ
ncbi:MAG: M48 family metallopeptidase [Proteobacteria bacterium]|nr:M48 family metallopeptidase [Pseudomonadota bacterium]